MSRAMNWLGAMLIAAILCAAGADVLTGPSDIQAARATQADAQDAAAAASRQWAISQVCGPNAAGGEWVADKQFRCLMKNGRWTGPVLVAVRP
jgi:type II secretory pathway pseudopilin PulG